jgi:hypothetical protein
MGKDSDHQIKMPLSKKKRAEAELLNIHTQVENEQMIEIDEKDEPWCLFLHD